MHYEEQRQDLFPNGELVRAPRKKGQQLAHEHICAAAHLWIWREREGSADVLLQQRALGKQTWPEYWHTSSAGHVNFGEQPLQSIIRETQEELNVQLTANRLYLAGVYRQYPRKYCDEIHISELQWVYTYKITDDIVVSFTDGEVSAVEWYPVEKILDRSFIERLPVVNYDPEYSALVVKTIKMQL